MAFSPTGIKGRRVAYDSRSHGGEKAEMIAKSGATTHSRSGAAGR